MIKTKLQQKTQTERDLRCFRNQLHNLLIKYPEIRLAGTEDGDVVAYSGYAGPGPFAKVYLPLSGAHELIK